MKKFSRVFVSLAAASALIFGAVHGATAANAGATTTPTTPITNASVGIQMFEWGWVSLKSECTNVLGPEGVDWILVSPPQESIAGSTWWVNYQPVSYTLDNNLGSRQQFADMVAACNAAGVQVVVDAVINHMAAASGTGFGTSGTNFSAYNFPGVPYTSTDFHAGLSPSDPSYCASGTNIDWNDLWSVQHCELLGLNDLATEKQSVRDKIDVYLNDLLTLGVAGFRVDAAGHIPFAELRLIQNGLNQTTGGTKPFFVQENPNGADANVDYAVQGQVFGWSWITDMASYFGSSGDLSSAQYVNGTYASLNPSAKTVTLVSNHDTERHGYGDSAALTYQDGKKYLQASIYTVVNQFGLPMLYTGFAYSDADAGPNMSGKYVAAAQCGSTAGPAAYYPDGRFICMQRWPAIKGAIAWKDAVGTAKATISRGSLGSWSDKYSTYSFKRGAGSFIVFNGGNLAVKNGKFKVSLPKGTYCDYITGGTKPLKAAKTCAGTKVVVDAKGYAVINVPWSGVVALSIKAKY